MAALPAHRLAFRRLIPAAYPGLPSSRYPALISQFHWFAHGIEMGDLAAAADEFRGFVYLGRANGPYEYRPAQAPQFNFRPVLWTSMIPLTQLPGECRERWRARTGLFPMGPILGVVSSLEGDALVKPGPGPADR